jgi:hypothetical protein
MQPIYTHSIFLGPTLAANHTVVFSMPFAATLIAVSHVNSTTNQGKIDIGSTSDDDAYLDDQTVGELDVPVLENTKEDFVGSQFPHIPAGTLVKVTITDHASHMANVAVVLWFAEG